MVSKSTKSDDIERRERPPTYMTKPLPQILDEMDANIRAAADAARRAEEAAKAVKGAAVDATRASAEAEKRAEEARLAGEKAAKIASEALSEATAKLEQIGAYIDSRIEEKIRELLGDPDAGLELRPEFEERLRQALESTETFTAEEVAEKLGLK